MSEYGKVVVGEPVDDAEAPLIATGVPYHSDIATATPTLYYSRPPPPTPGPPGVYGSFPPHPPAPPMAMYYIEPGEQCAQVGCWFSWIPLIGIINFFLNSDAAPQTRRQYFAYMSCLIATVVIVVNIVFWIAWFETTNDDCLRKLGQSHC